MQTLPPPVSSAAQSTSLPSSSYCWTYYGHQWVLSWSDLPPALGTLWIPVPSGSPLLLSLPLPLPPPPYKVPYPYSPPSPPMLPLSQWLAPLLSPLLPTFPMSPLPIITLYSSSRSYLCNSSPRNWLPPLFWPQGLHVAKGFRKPSFPGPLLPSLRVLQGPVGASTQFPQGAPPEFYPELIGEKPYVRNRRLRDWRIYPSSYPAWWWQPMDPLTRIQSEWANLSA